MQFREIVAGLGFIEGPVIFNDGRLLVTDVENGSLVLIDPTSGDTEILVETKGGPNGAALGPSGDLFICNNGGISFKSHNGLKAADPTTTPSHAIPAGIQQMSLDGAVSLIYGECEGHPLLRPNDIVFDAFGGFYFTDIGQAEGRLADLGGLYYAKADGSAITELIHNPRPHVPLTQPNGVGLSPDGTVIYVAETGPGRISSWDIVAPGELAIGSLRTWYGPSGGMFDSLAIDAHGNICVATLGKGGISVFSPEGEFLEFIELPTYDSHVSNICFGGPDLDIAYVTSSGRGAIWEITGWRTGLRLNSAPESLRLPESI